MAKIRKSMSFDEETLLKLEELALVRHDTSPSALTNTATAAIHALHSKLSAQTKNEIKEQGKRPKFYAMVLELYKWMKECKKNGGQPE